MSNKFTYFDAIIGPEIARGQGLRQPPKSTHIRLESARQPTDIIVRFIVRQSFAVHFRNEMWNDEHQWSDAHYHRTWNNNSFMNNCSDEKRKTLNGQKSRLEFRVKMSLEQHIIK